MPSSNIDVYIRLLNARRFQGGLGTASAGVRGFTGSMEKASVASSGLAASLGVAEGALYAVGSASRVAGYVVGAALTAGVAAGIKFNMMMQETNLAFERFTGGAKNAKIYTQQLWDVARQGPFRFEDLTNAARKLLAYGFTAKQTIPFLQNMGDAIALTGGSSQDEMLRLAKAMGDIQAKGRLMQQEMNQLANTGIPIREILARGGLKLTEYQLRNIGRAGIDANTAIEAINKGLHSKFGGGSKEYLNTLGGQFNTLQDNLQKLSGDATKSSMAPLTNGLKDLNAVIAGDKRSPVLDWFSENGPGAVSAVGDAFNFASTQVRGFLAGVAPIKPFISNIIWPLVKGVSWGVVGALVLAIDVLKIFAWALGGVGQIAEPISGVFFAIGAAIGFIFGGEIIDAISAVGKFGGIFRLLGASIRFIFAPIRMIGGMFEALTGIIFRTLNPGAITRLVDEMVQAFNSMAPRFMHVGEELAERIVMGLATLTKKIGSGIFRAALLAALSGKDFINAILGMLNNAIPNKISIPHGPDIPLPDNPFPMLAKGGVVHPGGAAIVGDAGMEMLQNKGGRAVVTPLSGRSAGRSARGSTLRAAATMAAAKIHLDAPIYLDRQLIGRAMGDYVGDMGARA